MSRPDSIKEELGWLKVLFGVMVAVDVSLVAWVAQNVGSPNRVLVWGAIFAVAVVTAGVVWINRLAYRRIKGVGTVVMSWAPVIALAILIVGLVLVVREANLHDHRQHGSA